MGSQVRILPGTPKKPNNYCQMQTPHTLEPHPSPKHKMAFLFDWLVTLKCNYDCSYCGPGVNGYRPGHDNSLPHPEQETCEKMLEQGFRYVDMYMEIKKPNMRSLNLNIYGGEALFRKDIEYLLERSSKLYESYKGNWHLNRMLTTNASSSLDKWKNISEHLEYVNFSYHAQGPTKLQDNFMRNIEWSHENKKNYGAIVLMYPGEWEKCMYVFQLMQRKGYNVRPRIIDGPAGKYTKDQLRQIFDAMNEKDYSLLDGIEGKQIDSKMRACCGGRPLCIDRNLKEPKKAVARDSWMGWKCSANQFFLFADCHSKKFFTNKDCNVRHDGTWGPLADIDTMDDYIEQSKRRLKQTHNCFLTCVQKTCRCGTCAPKSLTDKGLADVMKSYNITA